ncbi:MAG: hypothetical protein H6673_03645 [Anaerolineales bacterium]|nr:hypothetical protein [Anaerolineales bacterium]
MELIFSVPFGVFLILIALIWEPQPKTKKDLAAEQRLILAGEPVNEGLTIQQTRRYLRRVMQRVLLMVGGIVALLVGILAQGWHLDDGAAAFVLLGVYTGIILVVQRAERSRRVLVLWFMGFVGFMMWRYADYRGTTAEHHLGLIGGVVTNGLFWVLIGRRFPPGTSDAIEVIDKE